MKSHVIRAGMAPVILIASLCANAAPISGQGTWQTTLQARDLDRNPTTIEAYYDTDLNITWLANANAVVGSSYDTFNSGTGEITWSDANSWATSINIGGITGWRLPATNPINGISYDYTETRVGSTDNGVNITAPGTVYSGSSASELAHLYYNTLGNKAYYDASGNAGQSGWGLSNTGPFTNVDSRSIIWSESEAYSGAPWAFIMNGGSQIPADTWVHFQAWAVHSGDVGIPVSTVPEPTAAVLFGVGLAGLLTFSRRRAAHSRDL